MKNFIKNHPFVSYFFLTFGWSWGVVFYMIFSGVTVESVSPTFVIGGMLCNIAPSVCGLLVISLTRGKAGLIEIKKRLIQPSGRQLLVFTLTIVFVLNICTRVISNFSIRPYEFALTIPLIIMGLIWPVVSGLGEEFGWRGFVLPEMLKRFSPLKAGILLGLIWEVWHLPMHYMEFRTYGHYMVAAFLVIGFLNLTAHSVIMTNIYIRSKGNLTLMILYHATITGSAIIMDGFLKTVKTPETVVLEACVAVTLLSMVAAVLTVKDNISVETSFEN